MSVDPASRAQVADQARRRGAGLTVVPKQRLHPIELDGIASRWQLALDGAQAALGAAAPSLPADELHRRHQQLTQERHETARLLRLVGETSHVPVLPWLSPVPVTRQMLGLSPSTRACIFDLDGVLTDSVLLHAAAWAAAFDDFLLRFAERADWQFIPFDRDTDYYAYLEGRPRLEGVHTFLSARGIRIPEGVPSDPATADTAYGLAKRKGEALARGLRQRGVTTRRGARRYLEAAGHAGIPRAVVSASSSTAHMLELAALTPLVEEQVDAEAMRVEGLRSRPAPDLLIAACQRLGVDPAASVTFTQSPAGVAAGHAAGLTVVGVGDSALRERLEGFGADRVVASLDALLDRRLAQA